MDELVERVREALAAEYSGATDGRVRDVPDRRAIRWYTTIGLVDRPLGMRGRTALYGPRHLQQLVAIKRRQAVGRSLSQIQGELSWVSDEALAELSHVPERLLETDDFAPDHATHARHMRFWAQTPAEGRPPSFAAPPAPTGLTTAEAPPETRADTPAEIGAGARSETGKAGPFKTSKAAPFETSAEAAPEFGTAGGPAPDRSAAAKSAFGPTTATTTASTTTTTTATTTDGRAVHLAARNRRVGPAAGADQTSGTAAAYGAHTSGAATSVSGVALRGGAILLVPHPVSDGDRDDIAAAAAPLLDLLEARGLIDGRFA